MTYVRSYVRTYVRLKIIIPMSLSRQIAHNTAIQIIAKIISTLLGLVAIALMTRTLGVEKFGWYITATGFLQFIGILSDLGFTAATSSLLSRPEHDKKDLLNNLFTWRFLTAFLSQGLAVVAILFFPYPPEIKYAVAICAISFFGISLNQVFIAYNQTKMRLWVPSLAEILGRIILVVGIALVAFRGNSFLPIMWVITISSFVGTIYMWFKMPDLKFKITKELIHPIFQHIWPLSIAVGFNSFYLFGDRVILPLYVSQSQVGLYGAAYRVLDIIIQISAMIMGLLMPLAAYSWSRNKMSDFKNRVQISFDIMALLLFPMVAGILALSTPVMRFIAGNEFTASGNILSVLIFAIIGIFLSSTFGHLILAMGYQKKSMWIYISTAILGITGYFIFIPKYGIWGAAGVAIFTEILAGIALGAITIYYSKYIPKMKTLIKITLSSFLMGIIIFTLQPLNIILSVILGGVLYSLFIIMFKTISSTTLKEIFAKKIA